MMPRTLAFIILLPIGISVAFVQVYGQYLINSSVIVRNWYFNTPPAHLRSHKELTRLSNLQKDGESSANPSNNSSTAIVNNLGVTTLEQSQRRRQMLKWSMPILVAGFTATAVSPRNLFGSLVATQAVAATQAEVATAPVVPFSSTRRYKRISLRNGLTVLLVSDKTVAICQAAMSVPAGQFYDGSVPGLAHLMEHMILSTPVVSSTRQGDTDLESWLSEREGASNAFTANQKVCYHFTCPKQVFAESLERFAAVFRQRAVESVCRNRNILRREIRRVDSELNFDSVYAQEEHLTKAFVNLEHPYSVFSKGSIETLEQMPLRDNVNVGDRLVSFFRRYYLPQNSFLVVVGPQDFSYLERWVAPFSDTLAVSATRAIPTMKDYFPGQFLFGSKRYKQVVLKRKQADELPANAERLTLQWVTNLDYRNTDKLVTVNEVAFVLSQILSRRGPGSLYLYLKRRKWIPDSLINSLPRISIPVDVSGFQIIKLELSLTVEGFANRGEVVNAVYASINTVRQRGGFLLSRDLMVQYASVAKLFGYHLAPRPPDAVELAFDALVYNKVDVSSGLWYRFPSYLGPIRRIVGETLDWMSQAENALIIVTASERTLRVLTKTESYRSWLLEPISGARFNFDQITRPRSLLQALVTESVSQQEMLPPFYNPLVPNVLNTPHRVVNLDGSRLTEGEIVPGWFLKKLKDGALIPRQPVESEYGRCALVLQFLSPKPARANVRQAARGELWKLSFESFISDVAELGSPGGLAYDVSFNKFGIRLSFLGIGQTLPSYIRRLVRRLVVHQQLFLQTKNYPYDMKIIRSTAIASAKTAQGLSPGRRARIISNLRSASQVDIGAEGKQLIESITGVVAMSQGDFDAAAEVIEEVSELLSSSVDVDKFVSTPSDAFINALSYKPSWKPRFASGCYVAGVNLMSDACGRIPR